MLENYRIVRPSPSIAAVLPRITAKLPESFANSLNNTLQAGDHKVIEYIGEFIPSFLRPPFICSNLADFAAIEPNGEIKVSPLPGNLPNPPKRD